MISDFQRPAKDIFEEVDESLTNPAEAWAEEEFQRIVDEHGLDPERDFDHIIELMSYGTPDIQD